MRLLASIPTHPTASLHLTAKEILCPVSQIMILCYSKPPSGCPVTYSSAVTYKDLRELPLICLLLAYPYSPHSLHSRHSGFLIGPQTCQAYTCLRAFALAVLFPEHSSFRQPCSLFPHFLQASTPRSPSQSSPFTAPYKRAAVSLSNLALFFLPSTT